MQSIRSYRLSSSDESSSDESQPPELFQLPAPSKKLCTSREQITLQAETDRPSPRHLEFEEVQIDHVELGGQQEEEAEKGEQQEGEQQREHLADEFDEEEEEESAESEEDILGSDNQNGGDLPSQSQVSGSLPARKVRQKSYALDQKELPREMQIFLRAVNQFFTRQVNLERQTKPLASSTYRKAHERMLCELFRKFGENSFHDFILVSNNVLTSSFSCL